MLTTVPVGADRLHVEDSGGDGEPLVLLHPGLGDLTVWDPVLPLLGDGYRTVRYDFRGYGESPSPTQEYDWVDDLFAVMDHCGLASAHLVGTSQGGATAVEAALRRPDRVRSLVLLAPSVGGADLEVDEETEQRWEAAEAFLDVDHVPMLDLMLELWCAAGHEDEVRDLVRRSLRAFPGETAHLRPLPPAEDRLGEVTAPTVLLVGDRDLPSLVALDERMAAAIPGCRFVRLAGVDHLPTLRVPAFVAETIRGHCRPAG